MTRDAFHRQGPFVGSGCPCEPRSRDRHARFRGCDDRWMALSRHPGPLPVPGRSFRPSPTRVRVFARSVPRRWYADARSALGLRSLAPVALFGAQRASVFEVRRRLPTSATAFTTCGHSDRSPRVPRRDGGRDLLPFLTYHAISLAGAVTRGEPRIVPNHPIPVPIRPACAGFPDRDTGWPRHLLRLAPREFVAKNVHGSLDRAKDVSPNAESAWPLRAGCVRLLFAR